MRIDEAKRTAKDLAAEKGHDVGRFYKGAGRPEAWSARCQRASCFALLIVMAEQDSLEHTIGGRASAGNCRRGAGIIPWRRKAS